MPEVTRLSPEEERRYRAWMQQIGHTRDKGFAVGDDFTGENYDYRGYFKKYGAAEIGPDEHLTDEFKLPSHPTFSVESIYAVGQDRLRAGRWDGDTFVPPQPSTAPVMATREQEVRERILRARIQQEREKAVPATTGTAGVDTTPFPLPRAPYATGVPQAYKGSKTALAAAQAGVDVTTGAPAGRVAAGFAQNEALQAQELERVLSQSYGQPVKVRKGPQSGQLEFLNPETQRFTLVDEARLTLRDLQELLGPAITTGGAVAGEVLGGPPGAAVGGAAGEVARRAIGAKMGVRDETAQEVVRGAAGVGAVEGAASGVGNLAARAAQGARNLIRPRPVTPGEAQRLLTAAEANQVIAEEITARTGERFQPFTGQLAEDPLLLGEQARLMSGRETGPDLRAQQRQNETVLEKYFDIVNPIGGGPPTAVGRSIQTEARSQTQPRIEAIDEGVRHQVAELETATAALPRAQTQAMGEQLRQVAEEARAQLKVSEDAAWDGVRRSYGYNADTALSQYKVPVSGELATTLKRLKKEAEEAVDPATAAGKRQLTLLEEDGTVDLHQLQTYLSSLRRRERISRQGLVATDPEGRDISRLRDSLITQRNEYLRQVDPELLAEIEAAEALTASRARLFDSGIVGGLLRKIDGQYVITDSEVVSRAIGSGNPEAIQHLVKVLGTHPAGVPTLQRAMLATYVNEVVEDGVPRAQLHRKFIENHGQALDILFPNDGAKIRELGEFEKVVSENLKRFDDFVKGVEQSFRGRIQDIAPERIAEQVFQGSFSVKDVSRLASLAKQAGVLETYQRAVGDQIRRRFVSQTSGVNLNTLDKFVQEEAEKLRAVFGELYISDMNRLVRALKTSQTDAGGIAVTKKPTLIESIARGTVARPLSATGVGLTRLMRYRQFAADRALARAISDPEALRDIIKYGHMDAASRKGAQILAILGASTLATEVEPNMESTQ